MRQLGFGLLVLFVLGIGIYMLRSQQGPGNPASRAEFSGVFEDAFQAPDLGDTGPAWPGDEVMRDLRGEWHTLGAADSTLLDVLTQMWLYPESSEPFRLTTVTQVPAGRNRTLLQRLEFGEILAKHPQWRLGTLRHYPAAAAVLTSTEKTVLQYLGCDGADAPQTVQSLVDALELFPDGLEPALEELAAAGWVTADGEGTARTYELADGRLIEGGAMQFVALRSPGHSLDLPSIQAAFLKHRSKLNSGRVTLAGPGVITGRPVVMSLQDGRLKSGKPGKAWAMTLGTFGGTNGLFTSEKAFQSWLSRHPDAEGAVGEPLHSFLSRHLAGNS